MTRSITIAMAVLSIFAAVAVADEPNAEQIETAINEGAGFKFAPLQHVSDVKFLRGGETARGDRLLLCDATLVWNVSRDEIVNLAQERVSARATVSPPLEQFGFESLESLMVSVLKSKLGEFEKGDAVAKVRIRVRVERAGADWIVTECIVRPAGLDYSNPLDAFQSGAK